MNCKICSNESEIKYRDFFDDRYGYPGKFNIYQCPNCGFAQTNPELKKEQMAGLYTNYYPRQDITVEQVKASAKYRSGFWFKIKAWVLGANHVCHYYIKPNKKVLDIGCGSGASLLDIEYQHAEAYGIEEDRNIEPIAKQLDLNIFFGSLEQTNYPDNHFDFITMSQVLEHIQDPIDFLNLAIKKLKPGGKIILSFPNINSIYSKINGRKWINWHIPYHLNFFSYKSLDILTKKLAVNIDKYKTITPNIWTILQLRSNREKVKEGEKGKVWYPVNFSDKKQVLWASFFHGLHYLFIPINRIIDLFNRGDSFLIILSKK
ncbi:MAG: class I SAM-dependent methyltransferase [Patescibacteria group bacterium]